MIITDITGIEPDRNQNTGAGDMDTLVKERKKQIRRETKRRIEGLEYRYTQSADRQILFLLHSLPDYQNARNVFCFAGGEQEINTLPFLQQALD